MKEIRFLVRSIRVSLQRSTRWRNSFSNRALGGDITTKKWIQQFGIPPSQKRETAQWIHAPYVYNCVCRKFFVIPANGRHSIGRLVHILPFGHPLSPHLVFGFWYFSLIFWYFQLMILITTLILGWTKLSMRRSGSTPISFPICFAGPDSSSSTVACISFTQSKVNFW